MRILLITQQLCIIGALYLCVAMPLLAAVGGLVYLLITAAELVFTAALMVTLNTLLYYLMLSLGMLAVTAQPPVLVAAATSLAGIVSTLFTISLPFLLAVLVNLVLGVLAYYRDWYRKMRRWATICNIVGLCIYLVPQSLAMWFAIEPSGESRSAQWDLVLVLGLMMLAWDSYFIVSLILWRRMPERPDIPGTLGKMPSVHLGLWLFLATAWLFLLFAADFPSGVGLAIIGGVILVSALPFILNAKATKKIAAERKKRHVILIFLINSVLLLTGLILFPPVGVALLISVFWLYFLVEMVFLRPAPAPGIAAVSLPSGEAGQEETASSPFDTGAG